MLRSPTSNDVRSTVRTDDGEKELSVFTVRAVIYRGTPAHGNATINGQKVILNGTTARNAVLNDGDANPRKAECAVKANQIKQ